LPEGLVLWGVKNIYYVLERNSGKEYKCTIKGKVLETDFQTKGRSETNPIVVGDEVLFNISSEASGVITERKKRRNEFKRLKSRGRVVQTLFANVDYLLIIDSVDNPPLRPFFIDRCLLTADYMDITPVIIFNKTDLVNFENKDLFEKAKSTYRKLGYKVLEISVVDKSGFSELLDIIKNKVSSMHGRSGVGKSSLIKALDPAYDNIKIGEINKKYDRGVHTTTYSKVYPLADNCILIDTPGVRELSVYIDKPELVEGFFKDFDLFRNECRFSGCQHINEPDCRVKKALEEGLIESARYESYLRIRETVNKIDDSIII